MCSYLNILKPPGSSEGWSVVCTVVGVTVPAEVVVVTLVVVVLGGEALRWGWS